MSSSAKLKAENESLSLACATTLPGLRPNLNALLTSSQPTKILGTAVVRVRDGAGAWQTVRVLIDSCSHDSFVTMQCARWLGLPMRRSNVSVTGLGQNTVQNIKCIAFCSIMPKDKNNPQFDISCIVLPNITSKLPSVPSAVRNHFAHINLTDEHFDVPSTIDFLLEVKLFDQIYNGQRIAPGPGLPCALSSVFGWVITEKRLARDSNSKTEYTQFMREYEDLGHMQPVGSAPTRYSATEDKPYQHILWREFPYAPLQEYELITVTYGVSSSPYLAIRTLHQLADEDCEQFPLATKILRDETYLDDIITGCSSIENTIQLRDDLVALLKLGQFQLRK
ncbi:hypothetical protein EVAR_67872_1 [Eumeta japonica]|uniref:Uncharacterized protein n=1 Tax=Eumeta variegata TaxID=151549 RepID=A0A4C2A4P8_EUMVA|nr:hypothetical protein EVAR_67872_1 [Eumeta japonica]